MQTHTSQAEPTGNPTIDCCIDADRLDLPRVGITPDPERMLTEAGKLLAEEEWWYKKDFRNGVLIFFVLVDD